jgi:hypothetical protein
MNPILASRSALRRWSRVVRPVADNVRTDYWRTTGMSPASADVAVRDRGFESSSCASARRALILASAQPTGDRSDVGRGRGMHQELHPRRAAPKGQKDRE